MPLPSRRSTAPFLGLRLLVGCLLGYSAANFGSGLLARVLLTVLPRADALLLAAMPGFAVIIAYILTILLSQRPLRTGAGLCLGTVAMAVLFLGGTAR